MTPFPQRQRRGRWLRGLSLPGLLLFGQGVLAQTVINDHEVLAADRPEAWAMNYMAATSYMTAFGDNSGLGPGQWNFSVELAGIPRLSARQRQVGFDGDKVEDLNKSPVFGRVRLALGLPAGWVAELGYTPPLTINGARPRNLVAMALGHRVIARDNWNLSARAFGQHGSVTGDITCPAELAGIVVSTINPYGCQAPSDDSVALNYYGTDLTVGGGTGPWRWHADFGVVRTELGVQLNAPTFAYLDRTHLIANGVRRYLALGADRDLAPHWRLGAEVLYVPIPVRRPPGSDSGNDPLTSFRLQLRYSGG